MENLLKVQVKVIFWVKLKNLFMNTAFILAFFISFVTRYFDTRYIRKKVNKNTNIAIVLLVVY